jgi:DNA-binding CsgD family transcriptional regulator
VQETQNGPPRPEHAPLLLDRIEQLGRIEEMIEAAGGGRGALASVLGAPGEGKTSLLAAATELASARGMRVLGARGSHLEATYALGAVRQLLEPPLRDGTAAASAAVLEGPASVGAAALTRGTDLDAAERSGLGMSAAHVLHGLYWLLAALAEQGPPLLLCVDDAHWVDELSLQWLAYLRLRLDGLPVLVLAASRPVGESSPGALTALLGDTNAVTVAVGPLQLEAVEALVAQRLGPGAAADPGLAERCHQLTCGNPFALNELLAELARRGLDADGIALAEIGRVAPEPLTRNTLARLGRLGPRAVAAARSLAVLDDAAPLRRVAALGELEPSHAAEAVQDLAGEGVARVEQTGAVAFAHPLLRSAVYDSMPASARAHLHERAAAALTGERADPETVAAHLLLCEPSGKSATVDALRAAAQAAIRRGAATGAVSYLRRALIEPPEPDARGALLAELAGAELLVRSPDAVGHLREALAERFDPVQQARLRWTLADALLFQGGWDEALRSLEQAVLDAQAAQEPDLGLRLEGRLIALRTLDARGAGVGVEELTRLLQMADDSDLAGARPLRLNLALLLTVRGGPPERSLGLIERGLDDGAFLAAETADAIEAVHAAFGLVLLDRLPAALALTAAMLRDAARRGSVLGFLAGSSFQALAHVRAGRPADAEADLAGALELAAEHGLHFTIPFTASYLALALAEQGREREALALLEGVQLPAPLAGTPAGLTLLGVRGRMRRACGQRDAAIEDLRACGRACETIGVLNPNVVPWRSELALALAADSPAEAERLAAEELALARRAHSPRAVGVALTAQAALAAADDRARLLEAAIATLETVPAPLELARALIDLGAHMRRGGSRNAARDPLRRGLEIAERCGAQPLGARAREELLAAGGRPRRPWLSGVRSLTPSELRVARMAASGMSNGEIAQTLFITTQTVKGHLSAAYRKLHIAGREHLDAALREPD